MAATQGGVVRSSYELEVRNQRYVRRPNATDEMRTTELPLHRSSSQRIAASPGGIGRCGESAETAVG